MAMKTYQWFADAINLILLYIVIRSIDGLVTVSMGVEVFICDGIGIASIILYMYLVRVFIARLKIYQIMTVIPAIVLYKISFEMFVTSNMDAVTSESVPILIKAKLFVVLACMVGLNVYYWSHDDADEASSINMVFIIAVIVSYITVVSKGATAEGKLIFTYGIIFIALAEIRNYLDNLIAFGELEQITEDMPVKEMYVKNSLMALPSVILGVVAMVFIKSEKLEAFIAGIVHKIEYYLAWLLSKSVETGNANDVPLQREEEFFEFPVIEEEGLFTGWIGYIIEGMFTILIVAVILFTIYAVGSGVIAFVKKDGIRLKKGRSEFLVPDGADETRESLVRISGKRQHLVRNATEEEKFRILYKKKVLAAKKKGVSVANTYTPVEIEENAKREKDIDISEATSLYESRRYKEEYVITKEDVSLMKKAVKG